MIATPSTHAPAPHLAAIRALVRTALLAIAVIAACGPVSAPDDAVRVAQDDIAASLRIIDRASRRVIGLGNQAAVDAELARIGQARRHAQQMLARLETSVRDPQGLRLLANVRDAAMRYQPLERSFERLLREGRTEDARHLLTGEFRPVQLDYFNELKKIFRHQEQHRLAMDAQAHDSAVPQAFVAILAGLLLAFHVLGYALWQWLVGPDAPAAAEVRAGGA